RARLAAEEDYTGRGSEYHGQRQRPPAGARVSRGAPQVTRDRLRPAELLAADADPDVEAVREDEVGEPERDAQHEDGASGKRRVPQSVAVRVEYKCPPPPE